MEKNTVLAVILSTVVIIAFYALLPKPQPVQTTPADGSVNNTAQSQQQQPVLTPADAPVSVPDAEPLYADNVSGGYSSTNEPMQSSTTAQYGQSDILDSGPLTVQYVEIETELIKVALTNAGGDMVSWKLKEHLHANEYIEMILSGVNEPHAFSLALGGLDAQPVTSYFHVKRLSEYSVEFYRDFLIPGSGASLDTEGKFRLTKRYDFKPRDYMFELTVTMDGGYSAQGFNFAGSAYTLAFGPQIGPKFAKLDNHYDYRHYVSFNNGKRKNVKANDLIDTRPQWAAISGKYFVFIAIPFLTQYTAGFSEKAEPGIVSASRFNIIRPAASAPKITDTYRFYIGPKTQEALAIYNTGKNEFGMKDMNLVEAANTRGFLAPLERVLKWLLLVFYNIVPNYGVAIILLTLLVKILFFPLTKKSSLATVRMQALAPKIKELQEKYKGNTQKLNAEMAVFYKQEGYNPVSGCLPLLLQIPIFFAMYNLFNNHFDLRGAKFIPGWIPDLSVPEFIWNFPEGLRLPLLGWTALRMLPFIYVGSQLLYGKVTQMPGQQSNTQMKMMLYVMPVVFFFILYDVPSGLLIYWIFSNLLTLVQQVIINKYFLPRAKKAEAEARPVIAPGKKKK